MVEHLPSVCKAQDSIPNTLKKKKKPLGQQDGSTHDSACDRALQDKSSHGRWREPTPTTRLLDLHGHHVTHCSTLHIKINKRM